MQPGWFQGHATAFMYINLGLGVDGPDNGPQNFSFPMIPVFQITGPSKGPYPGEFCLPQVPLPANLTVQKGDLATIQVVEVAVHGASLFNVSCPQRRAVKQRAFFPRAVGWNHSRVERYGKKRKWEKEWREMILSRS